MRVLPGGDKARGLVEQDSKRLLLPNKFVINFDMVAPGDLSAEIGTRLSVHGNATSRNQLIAASPGTEPGRG
jgi:hypothetical protein